MFYFAAASFSEMARRLDSPRTPRGFLCGDNPDFVAALLKLSPAGNVTQECYGEEVAAAVENWNVAGLCDRRKRNWYGVDLEDTVRAAARLGLTVEEVRSALEVTAV
jgi:FADH2 O2-dependent halogenase